MKGKVKCTCGWSWNKSDSSAKDMYICHECGRDNSNNIPKAQEGLKTMSSRDKRGVELLLKETENAKKDKRELQTTGQIKNPKSIAYKSKVKKQPELKQDNRTDYEREYDREKGQAKEDKKQFKKNIIAPLDVATDIMQLGNFVPHPIGQAIGKIGNIAGASLDAYQTYDALSEGNYTDAAINAGSVFLPMGLDSKTFRRNSKYLQPGQPLYPFSPQARNNFIDRAHYIEPFNKVKGMTDTSLLANRALLGTLGAETIYDTFGGTSKSNDTPTIQYYNTDSKKGEVEKPGQSPNVQYVPISNSEELKRWKQQKSKSSQESIEIPQGKDIYAFEGKKGVVAKNGGWLDNYNDSQASAPEGMVGDGYSNVGRNYSPAWGGQFEEGGEIPMAQKGYQTSKDSVAHQANKILKYEQLKGGPGGIPLPQYADPQYMDMLMNKVYPEVKKIMPKASAMETGEAMDFIFNAGWDKDNNKITKDPRAFALQEYYRQNDKSKLDKDGKWSGRKNAAYSFDDEYANTIGKLPENQRRLLMNKGRDWYYKNINNSSPGVPSSDYNDTWYGRIWNTNDYNPFNPNNPKFTPKKQMGGNVYPVNYVPQAQNGYRMGTYFDEDAREREPNMMEETYDDYNTGMTGMMKSKMATQATLGNKSAQRMMSSNPSKYIFTGNERFSDGSQAEGAGAYGTHYMSNRDNYVYPNLQDNGEGTLNFIPNASSSDREAMRFENPGEADYFANHYKEVAPMMKHYNKLAMGGSIPGSVGFTYARTKGIPSEGPYAKKTMPSAQNGVDMYGAPITAIETVNPNVDRTSYDARTNRMILGYDTTAENRNKAIAHENYHASQYKDNRMNYDIAHHTDNEQWARMQKQPSMVSTNDVWSNYYDRKPREINDFINSNINNSEFLKSYVNTVRQGSPNVANDIISDTIYNRTNIDKQLYQNPNTSEGEAQLYEDTGKRSFVNGGEMQYYREGLDFQPKTISRNGSVIKDDMGYWNPDNWGSPVEIGSTDITMEGVYEPLLGISDTGDTKLMEPGKNYKFKGKKVTEFPMAKNGLRQEQKGLVNLDNLTNFTNYNKPQPGGWLNKYN
jgi:hypothetical protein